MCGIAGYYGGDAVHHDSASARHILQGMGDAIAHRGPDGEGIWHDPQPGIGLAHRRLAIVDLSPTGVQPMLSASGRYVLVFNGEIYNHRRLRDQLQVAWRGTSDTETVLAGFDAWGIRGTLERLVGMFALAIWDRSDQRLTLARDRLGEKPLYFGWCADAGGARTLVFGSELSALRAHPDFRPVVDRNALRNYLRYGHVGGALSIYEGVGKLPAGSLLSVRAGAVESGPTSYWRVDDTAVHGARQRFAGTPAQAVDALESLLRDAVSQQMVADVPLGAFLSGGVDSSLVAALMQRQSGIPVQTYSIGFEEAAYNEAHHAAAVAKHLGTAHTELYISAQDALDLVPKLATIYSEPFADSSQIATHLLARLTRRHVTVALSGDGADELFGGYNRYQFTDQMWHRLAGVPIPMRRLLASVLNALTPAKWDVVIANVARVWPAAGRWAHIGDKVHKTARVLTSPDLDRLYVSMTSQLDDPGDIVIGGTEPAPMSAALYPLLRELQPVEQMMALDLVGYLCDDVLVKVDRAAMAASLETRAPFLDHRVVEFAWSLPLALKLRDGQTKWALRQVLYRHVPAALIERPKAGFGVPIGNWLRGPLRAWAESLLDPGLLLRQGYFRPDRIRHCWAEHQSGLRNWESQLWTVLMFQAWLQKQTQDDKALAATA